RDVARGLRPREEVANPVHVAADVKLEDLRPVAGLRYLFKAGLRDGADHGYRAEFTGTGRRRRAAVGRDQLERADRRDADGKEELGAEEGGRGVDLGDVDEDARPEGNLVEGGAIATQGRLRLRPANEVIPRALVERLARGKDYRFEGVKIRHLRFSNPT